MKWVLASTSPRRRELLATLNIPFGIIEPLFEERPTGRSAKEEALYFAEQKALSVAAACPDSLVLASDTLIEYDGAIFGKPIDAEDARRMLKRLSGKTHRLFTAVVLLNTAKGEMQKHVERVEVAFRPLSAQDIAEYVATGESLGKAGAYAAQGEGKRLIHNIRGDINAVVGLPLDCIKNWLKKMG